MSTFKTERWGTLTATNDTSTSTPFFPKRGCRIINESGAAATFTVYEENPITKTMVHCEDVAAITIADNSSKVIDTVIFSAVKICLKLSTSNATLYYVSGQ